MTMNTQEREWKSNWREEDANAKSDERDSAEISSEINATRSRLSNHLDEIQERLQPENLKEHAQEAVHSALTEGVLTVQEYVNDYMQNINWNELRDGVLDTVRRNPVPTALIGLGVGWMLLGSTRSHSLSNGQTKTRSQNAHSNGYRGQKSGPNRGWSEEMLEVESHEPDFAGSESNGLKDKVQDIKETTVRRTKEVANQVQQNVNLVGEKVGDLMDNWEQSSEEASEWGQEQVQNFGATTQRYLNENPLLFGAIAVAVGAGLGMMLPASQLENQALGQLREATAQKAQEVVGQVKERAQVALEEIRPGVEKAASNVMENVQAAGQQAVSEVRQSLQKAGEKLDEQPKAVTNP